MKEVLAIGSSWHQYGVMDQMEVFRRVLDEAPGSVRELARAAHMSHSVLSRIRSGERPLTPEVVDAVATALEGWSATCAELAAHLRQAKEER